MYFWYYLQFFNFTLKNSFMFMQLVFSKVHLACHNMVNGIKPGSNSKRLIIMLRIAQKLYVGV